MLVTLERSGLDCAKQRALWTPTLRGSASCGAWCSSQQIKWSISSGRSRPQDVLRVRAPQWDRAGRHASRSVLKPSATPLFLPPCGAAAALTALRVSRRPGDALAADSCNTSKSSPSSVTCCLVNAPTFATCMCSTRRVVSLIGMRQLEHGVHQLTAQCHMQIASNSAPHAGLLALVLPQSMWHIRRRLNRLLFSFQSWETARRNTGRAPKGARQSLGGHSWYSCSCTSGEPVCVDTVCDISGGCVSSSAEALRR